jgi:hypothetical protein
MAKLFEKLIGVDPVLEKHAASRQPDRNLVPVLVVPLVARDDLDHPQIEPVLPAKRLDDLQRSIAEMAVVLRQKYHLHTFQGGRAFEESRKHGKIVWSLGVWSRESEDEKVGRMRKLGEGGGSRYGESS